MGRNYFSKHGGPYFINDGLSHHDEDHKPGKTHEHIKPNPNLFYGLAIGFVSLLVTIGISLTLF